MKKIITFISIMVLSGCANATRTMPVLFWEEKPIPSYDISRPRLEVPKDTTVLPKPKGKPLPPVRPYDLNIR
jgi:hypothetical protein